MNRDRVSVTSQNSAREFYSDSIYHVLFYCC